jgi:hypothetical protein
MPKPNRVQTLQQQQPPPKPAPVQASKPVTPTPPKPASSAASTPGKGPKTFDEMGIGQAPKDSDCVSYITSIAYQKTLANISQIVM